MTFKKLLLERVSLSLFECLKSGRTHYITILSSTAAHKPDLHELCHAMCEWV